MRRCIYSGWRNLSGQKLGFNQKLFEDTDILECVTQEVVPVVAKQTELVDSSILENLTGNRLTARNLGNKILCSAQMINKMLVAGGFAVR